MASIKIHIGSSSNSSTNVKQYVYCDVNNALPPNANRTDVIVNLDVNAVIGSLRNLFTFSPGERVMEPEYGMNLTDALYEPMNDNTARNIGMIVFNAIKKWEPRIKVVNINVSPDYNDNTYYIKVDFRLNGLAASEPYSYTHTLSAMQ